MIWKGNELLDATTGTVLAEATSDSITFDPSGTPVTLEITSDNPSDFRAAAGDFTFAADGAGFVLERTSFTTSVYVARCEDRSYTLQRKSSGFLSTRRFISKADGTPVAVTRAQPNGDLEVNARRPLDIDLVFMTWALTYVDTPARRTLY